MEFHQLRYFCSVVQSGNFTKAADLEGITQPSLSQQIQRLEKTVGAELFVRLGRSVRLTHAGRVLYPHARSIIEQAGKAASQVRQLETEIRGPLRVGVIPTVLPYFIAPHVQGFAGLYPEVDLILTEDQTDTLVERLQSCDLDIIIVSLPIKGADLVIRELVRDPLVLVASKEHKFTATGLDAERDLSGERLFLLKEGHCFRDDMLTACKRSSAELTPSFESDHFGTIFPLVAAGSGVTIAPMMAADFATNCAILPLPKSQARRIGFARHKSGAHFKPLVVFSKWLQGLAEKHKAHQSLG